jgi:PPM family protein phosphatase
VTTRSTDTVCGLATSAGHRRRRNEDAALPGPYWYLVADGMGGHADGHVASRLVIDTFASAPTDRLDTIDGTRRSIVELVDAANRAVRSEAASRGALGMGSTVVGLAPGLAGIPPVVFHVGDSRCYRLVDGELRLLTRDHSHVQELIDANQLTTEQAARHPLRNVVTRSIGIEPSVDVEVVGLDQRPSRYLLCTDGLTDEIGPRIIGRVLSAIADPRAAAERLVELALEGAATDNLTALVVDIDPMRENDPTV